MHAHVNNPDSVGSKLDFSKELPKKPLTDIRGGQVN